MFLYNSVYEFAEVEQIIQKSRFIVHVKPVSSYEEGQAFVADIKAKYKDATHNVPVIVCGNKQEFQWASEDGEPQGTAGAPMLRVVVEEGLTNLALVVTRYFGGTKLGTGGLVRAYSGLAKAGIEAAGRCEVREGLILDYELDYSYLQKFQNLSQSGVYNIDDIVYTNVVAMRVSTDLDDGEQVKTLFNDVTAGKCELRSELKKVIKKRC